MSESEKKEIKYIHTIDTSGIESVAPVFFNEKETISTIINQARRSILNEKAERDLERSRKIRLLLEKKSDNPKN